MVIFSDYMHIYRLRFLSLFIAFYSFLSSGSVCSSDKKDQKSEEELFSSEEPAVDFLKIGSARTSLPKFAPSEKVSKVLGPLSAAMKRTAPRDHENKYKVKKNSETTFFSIEAKVNGDVITNIDIDNISRFTFFSTGKGFNEQDAALMRDGIIQGLIDGLLYQQVAKRLGLNDLDKGVDEQIQRIAEANNMDVESMAKEFCANGISMEVFKKNIRGKMIVSTLMSSISSDIVITPMEIAARQKAIKKENQQNRYHLFEILFRIDKKKDRKWALKTAGSVLKLLEKGYDFRVLAEWMSQGNYSSVIGDLGWVSEYNIPPSERNVVTSLKVGEHTGIIETKAGVKILFLGDKAAPGKGGSFDSIYHYITAKIPYGGSLRLQSDMQKTNEFIGKIQKMSDPDELKKALEDFGVTVTEGQADRSDPHLWQIMPYAEGQPVITSEEDNVVTIIMVKSKEIPDIVEKTPSEVRQGLIDQKLLKEFVKQRIKNRSLALIEVF